MFAQKFAGEGKKKKRIAYYTMLKYNDLTKHSMKLLCVGTKFMGQFFFFSLCF